MTSQNDDHDKKPAAAALDAPLTLPADKLELVAGGMMPSAMTLRPIILGLISGQPMSAPVAE